MFLLILLLLLLSQPPRCRRGIALLTWFTLRNRVAFGGKTHKGAIAPSPSSRKTIKILFLRIGMDVRARTQCYWELGQTGIMMVHNSAATAATHAQRDAAQTSSHAAQAKKNKAHTAHRQAVHTPAQNRSNLQRRTHCRLPSPSSSRSAFGIWTSKSWSSRRLLAKLRYLCFLLA